MASDKRNESHPQRGVDPAIEPSGPGCAECTESGEWWFHLRRCAQCGHVGCCDSSPQQHATRHFNETGHPVMASFEPGEHWFWSYETSSEVPWQQLASPMAHPKGQPIPGPAGKVPVNWLSLLHR